MSSLATEEYTEVQTQAIDWPLCVELANNHVELAEEVLGALMATLPRMYQDLLSAMAKGELIQILKVSHYLYEAGCFCGVPRMQSLAESLGLAARAHDRKKMFHLVQQLTREMTSALRLYENKRYRTL